MDPNDRRRDVRAHASPIAHVMRIGGSERVEVLNASYRGMFVRTTSAAPPLNQLLRIRVELPTRSVDLNAIAVRVVQDADGRPGVGVRFFAMNGEEKRAWASYITSLIALPGRRIAA